jgi:hypothetical protein
MNSLLCVTYQLLVQENFNMIFMQSKVCSGKMKFSTQFLFQTPTLTSFRILSSWYITRACGQFGAQSFFSQSARTHKIFFNQNSCFEFSHHMLCFIPRLLAVTLIVSAKCIRCSVSLSATSQQYASYFSYRPKRKSLSFVPCFKFCKKCSLVRYQILTAASVKISVFWDVAPCSLAEVYRCFRGACCLHHQVYNPPDDRGMMTKFLLGTVYRPCISRTVTVQRCYLGVGNTKCIIRSFRLTKYKSNCSAYVKITSLILTDFLWYPRILKEWHRLRATDDKMLRRKFRRMLLAVTGGWRRSLAVTGGWSKSRNDEVRPI